MKKFNLAKEFLFNGVLIGVLSIGLASCGGGGGGSSSSSTPLSFSTYLYSGTDYFNEPIITVYIDGRPVKLLVDTALSGLVVNSTAVNIPSSDIDSSYLFFSSSYGGISGTMASATVCLDPSITNSCVVMPIGVMSPNTSFPATGEAQGDFGLASALNSIDIGYNSSSSSLVGLSYPTYLEMQYGINSYTISFYPLSNGYYSDVSSTTPIGWISFGIYNGNSNTLISYTMNNFLDQPTTTVIFPSSTSSTPSFTDYATFATTLFYNYLSRSVFQTEIPNFSQSADEGACANYKFPSFAVNGGYSITYILQTNSSSFKTESFTTEPSLSFCEAGIPFTLMEGFTLDGGPATPYEFFGLPAMLGHTFTWVLSTSGTNQGFVQDIGISP